MNMGSNSKLQHENKLPYTTLLVSKLIEVGNSILRSISYLYNLHNGVIRGGIE